MTNLTDTDATTRARYLALLRAVPGAERLARALALPAFVRDLAWQGAHRHAGHRGAEAVVRRFIHQLYGPEVAARIGADRAEALRGE